MSLAINSSECMTATHQVDQILYEGNCGNDVAICPICFKYKKSGKWTRCMKCIFPMIDRGLGPKLRAYIYLFDMQQVLLIKVHQLLEKNIWNFIICLLNPNCIWKRNKMLKNIFLLCSQ